MASPVFSRLDSFGNKPFLRLEIEPESKHRFRYLNSDTGSHGVICGKNSETGKKTYPKVQLVNYHGSSSNIVIRVTLCTGEGTDHVHQFKQKKSSELSSYVEATLNRDFCAVFEDLSIMIPGDKKKGHEILMKRKIENLGEDLSESDREEFEKEHIEEVKKEYKEILHCARLRFDAFEKGNPDDPICEPIYSDTISNGRAPCSGELEICDMSKYSGSWKGGEDIILLCSKIKKKNVKIKFFETDGNQTVWEADAPFDLSNIHHQVAIKFRTPPYRANMEKTVFVRLEQETEMSELWYFTYMPDGELELKICHMSKITGSCEGNEDVILLCEKIPGDTDNVQIKFFETEDGENSWEAYASISDIHHQVAIKFKTPPYEPNIKKIVALCLEQGDKRSAPRDFTYIPEDNPSKRKKCVPGKTVNLISNSMGIASSSCISEGMPDNILKDQPQELLASLEEIFNGENSFNYSSLQDLEPPSSELDPESLKDFQLNSIVNLFADCEDESMELPVKEFEEQVVYQFSPNPDNMGGVTMDIGKLTGKIALISTDDSEISVGIPKEVSKKESKDKILGDKYKKYEKYFPFLSNRDRDGNSLLHLAVLYNKSVKNVLYMIKISKSDIINAKNNKEQTALHLAVENKSDVVVELLESYADPNIKDADGNNCFHIACHQDLANSLMCMSNEAYNPEGLNDFNNEGLTPLHIALKNYSPACLDILLKKCRHLIDFSLVDSNLGKSFLHYAVEYSPTYVPLLLKEYQIAINRKDFEGRTPLLIAYLKGNHDLVSQLLSAGATPEKRISKLISSFPDYKQAPLRVREASVRHACLNKASKGPPEFNGSNEDKESARIFEELAKKLSVLLDPGMKWKKLATYVLDEKYSNSLVECSRSPTRVILEFMKKTLGEQYIEQLLAVLDLIGFSDAVIVITEICQTSIVK